MPKFIVVFDDAEGHDPDGKALQGALRERFPMEDFTIHPLYRSAYDIDYNMTKFLCLPPVGDPQPLLADEEYFFKIGLATTPDKFDRIKGQVERLADELFVDVLTYESHGKDVSDAASKPD